MQKTQPQKRKTLSDLIKQDDLLKAEEARIESQGVKVDREWMLMAEFGRTFGWEAYKDARDDNIGIDEMVMLLLADRKNQSFQQYNNSLASFIGAGAAKAGKKSSSVFKQMTAKFLKNAKADE